MISTLALGASKERHPKQIVIIGSGDASDKELQFDSGQTDPPRFRWNNSTGLIEFSNDGTNFSDVGSGAGGGGGLNDLSDSNPACEAATAGVPNDWVISGGTLADTNVGGELINGLQSCTWDSNGTSQTLDSATVNVSPRNLGKNCLERVYYRYEAGAAANGDLTVTVFDGTNPIFTAVPVLTTTDLAPETGLIQLAFTCPQSGNYRIRFTSTVADPELFIWDDTHLGEHDKVGETTSVTETPWTAYTRGAAWTSIASTETYSRYIHRGKTLRIETAVEMTGAASGQISIPLASWIPSGFTYDSTIFPAGGMINCGTAQGIDSVSAAASDQHSSSVFFDPATGDLFMLDGSGGGNGTGDEWDASSPFSWQSGDTAFIKCHDIPVIEGNTSDQTVTLETQGWLIDANIGGALIALGVASVATYTAPNDAGLDLVINTDKRSVNVGIACSGTNASDPGDLVCGAGNEEPGIVFNAPYSGMFEVCADFMHEMRIDTAVTVVTIFQLVQTTNSTQTIIQEGDTRKGNATSYVTGTDDLDANATNICGTFSLTPGKTTIRLMYEQLVTGVPDFSQIQVDRATNRGQRDLHYTVRPLTQNFPQAVALEGYEETTFDISSSGEFDAAQPVIKIARFKNMVTMSWVNLAHSSTSTPETAAGVIPLGFRPAATYGTGANMGASQSFLVNIKADGSIEWLYFDWAGAGSARTSTGNGTISWVAN